MLPLRDSVRPRSFPIANYTLIGLNVLVFLFEFSMARGEFRSFLTAFGLVPSRLTLAHPLTFLTLFSSIFLHGSWFHLISNMWTLFIFGDNVEDRMGTGRYLLFYMMAGMLAGLSHAYFMSGSQLPTVGASGAIAGVLGAYLVLFPGGRVLTLIPLFFLPWFVEIPAFIYLGVWFFSQLSSGLMSLGNLSAGGNFSGIAWWAHIGGFVAGVVFVRAFIRRRRRSSPLDFTP
ncbi:MAG: rhomboid family intramembrane serine protease [Anaerolineales bacterium]|nr:rhomboid family intramembrane serine protease [Anaerolineales bacterium]